MEEFRINNHCLAALDRATVQSRINPGDQAAMNTIQIVQKNLISETTKLKQLDCTLKIKVGELFALLDQRGIK